MGLAVMETGDLLVVCREEGVVRRYTREGKLLGHLCPSWSFSKPSDILILRGSGQIVVMDQHEILLFTGDGESLLKRRICQSEIDSCYGLAEDDSGHLLTVNCNEGQNKRPKAMTGLGQTDVFFIDIAKDRVVKRIELVDVIAAEERVETRCRSLSTHAGKVYVVDQGKGRVFVFYTDADAEDSAAVFGESGNGPLQFKVWIRCNITW